MCIFVAHNESLLEIGLVHFVSTEAIVEYQFCEQAEVDQNAEHEEKRNDHSKNNPAGAFRWLWRRGQSRRQIVHAAKVP